MASVASSRPAVTPPRERPTSLHDLGICLRRESPGEHRCRCPECSGDKPRARENLAVRLLPDGSAVWHCHKCAWAGRLPEPGRELRREYPLQSTVAPPPEARPFAPNRERL